MSISKTLFNKTNRLLQCEVCLIPSTRLLKIGAVPVGVVYDEQTKYSGIVFEHESFDEVPKGDLIPSFISNHN